MYYITMFIRKHFTIFLMLAAGAVLFFLCTDWAWARAGGGDGYSGGGSFGSSASSNGGSGDGFILYLLIQLVFRHPLIGIPLLIVFVAAGGLSGKKMQNSHVKRTIKRGVQRQNEQRQNDQFDKIRSHDPHFDPAKLIERVKTAFVKIQEAWSGQNMDPVRGFVTDGLAERYGIQFDIQRKDKIRNVMENVTVHSCEIAGVESDVHFESIHFKIRGSAHDTWVSIDTDKVVKGDRQFVSSFVEFWTFIRRPGTQTSEKPGLIEGFCPNCGSPLHMAQSAKCEACGSLVISGEYDWILAKITQESEWRFRHSKRGIEGVAAFQASDPGFNVPFIEDRVSVVFWRYQKALLMKDIGPLQKMATPEFCQKVQKEELDVRHRFYKNVAVGLSEVYKVAFGIPRDKVYVQVKWEGYRVEEQNGELKENPAKSFYSHLLTMARKNGVQTDKKKGLMSAHCQGCGAPVTSGKQDQCEYCGNFLSGGDFDWVIEDFSPHTLKTVEMGQTQYTIQQAYKPKDRILDPVSLLGGLVLVMMADGKIDKEENKLLDDFVKDRHIPQKKFEDIKAAALTGQLQMSVPADVLEGSDWIESMISMCLADGEVTSHERDLLLKFGQKVGMVKSDVDMRIKKIRQTMYTESKMALHN